MTAFITTGALAGGHGAPLYVMLFMGGFALVMFAILLICWLWQPD